MSKDKEQINMEELYYTNDIALIKKAIAGLTDVQDNETLYTLLRPNSNTRKLDTRSLNEGIPQENKRFTKRNCKLCNVTRSTPRKQECSQGDTYITRYYSPNDISYGYVSRIRSKY